MKDLKTFYEDTKQASQHVIDISFEMFEKVLSKPPYNFIWKYKSGQNLRQNTTLAYRDTVAGSLLGNQSHFRIRVAFDASLPDADLPLYVVIGFPNISRIEEDYLGSTIFSMQEHYNLATMQAAEFGTELNGLADHEAFPSLWFTAYNFFIGVDPNIPRPVRLIRTLEFIQPHMEANGSPVHNGHPGFIQRLRKKYMPPDSWTDSDLVDQL